MTSESDAGCAQQNGGQCIQLGHDVVNECDATADDSDTLTTAAAASADVDVVDSDMTASQNPVDGVDNDMAARDVDVHDEQPAAPAVEVLNEPQQQPAAAAADDDADVVEPVGNIIPPPLVVLAPQGLGDVHQAMMQGGGPVGFQPYKHPNLFALRVIVCFSAESYSENNK